MFRMDENLQRVFDQINEEDTLSLAKQLIAIPSPPGGEGPGRGEEAQRMERRVDGRVSH